VAVVVVPTADVAPVLELVDLVVVVEVAEEIFAVHLDGELMGRCLEQQLPVAVVEANLSGLQMRVYQQQVLVALVSSFSNGTNTIKI
jgi:hypothetical protein